MLQFNRLVDLSGARRPPAPAENLESWAPNDSALSAAHITTTTYWTKLIFIYWICIILALSLMDMATNQGPIKITIFPSENFNHLQSHQWPKFATSIVANASPIDYYKTAWHSVSNKLLPEKVHGEGLLY